MSGVENRLRDLVADHFCGDERFDTSPRVADRDQLTSTIAFVSALGFDSLDRIELEMLLEEEFGIVGPDPAIAEAILNGTFGDLLATVEAKIAAGKHGQ